MNPEEARSAVRPVAARAPSAPWLMLTLTSTSSERGSLAGGRRRAVLFRFLRLRLRRLDRLALLGVLLQPDGHRARDVPGGVRARDDADQHGSGEVPDGRSEERRVGKEGR